MNNEIKEIDRVLLNVKRKLQFSPERRFVELFDKSDIDKLLDYITNLEQENERLRREIGLNKGISYKTRCKKAIEYIKSGKTFDNEDIRKVVDKIQNDLLNILQGSDKDE